MENSVAVTPQVGITEIHFVTVPNVQGEVRRGHHSFHEENGTFTCWMYHVRISAQ